VRVGWSSVWAAGSSTCLSLQPGHYSFFLIVGAERYWYIRSSSMTHPRGNTHTPHTHTPHTTRTPQHTHTHKHTDRTPLNEGSARLRDSYLHNTQHSHKKTSMQQAGFEPTIPASKWPQTHTLDSAATGIENLVYRIDNKKNSLFPIL